MKSLLTIAIIFLLPNLLWGHARFLPGGNTPARNNSSGLKTGPCGGVPKAATPNLTFNMGQNIALQWEETINHPGRYEFSISSDNDQTFTLLLTVPDDQDDNNTPHRYQATLTLPAGLTCANCTLQMVQQMTENPANPRPYFSCVDIAINNSGTDTPTNPVDPDPTNPPPTAEDCHDGN